MVSINIEGQYKNRTSENGLLISNLLGNARRDVVADSETVDARVGLIGHNRHSALAAEPAWKTKLIREA